MIYNVVMSNITRQKYGGILRSVRKNIGMSQASVARRLGMSRTSYIAVEQDKKDLTIVEAQNISDILGIELVDIIENKEYKREKYKQMIFFFLRLFKKSHKSVPKTKLAKLLYLADFAYYYEQMVSMSGLRYRKIDYGPVPDDYFSLIEELDGGGEISVKHTNNKAQLISETRVGERISDDMLSSEEKKLMRKIYKKWKSASTKEIVKFTHRQIPYEFADYKGFIPYELILQEDHGNIY